METCSNKNCDDDWFTRFLALDRESSTQSVQVHGFSCFCRPILVVKSKEKSRLRG